MVCFLVLPETSVGQGFFWHPPHGALRQYPGSAQHIGNRPFRRGLSDGFYRQFELPACPQYKPIAVSTWQEVPGSRYSTHVSLPGVRPGDYRVWLSSDGASLHVRAVRALPARGSECVPGKAHLSQDGRHEILDATVPLPDDADSLQVAVKNAGDVLEVILPKKVSGNADQSMPNSMFASEVLDAQTSSPNPSTMVVNDGIEITDEETPEPEKDADAAEGWWDLRGEFHEYGE